VRALGPALVGVTAAVAVGVLVIGSTAATEIAPVGGLGRDLRPGSVPAQLADLVRNAGRRCTEAPPSVLAAQLEAESAWNPTARSPAGALGIAQFLPGTWRRWGRDADGDGLASPWTPADAIAAQAEYDCALAARMRAALRSGEVTGPLTDLMLAAYNAGPGAVLAAGGVPPIQETRDYVARITARAAAFADSTGPTPDDDVFAARLVQIARSQVGTPYSWGGGQATGPSEGFGRGAGTVGYDCSGLVLFAAYQASGGSVRLPHSADRQTRVGKPVPRADLRPGDVVSFTHPGADAAHHVGIYLGSGMMVDAPNTGGRVRVESLRTSYWEDQQWRAVRYRG
jgi:cell wall-associated NlpC family hydrolase